MSGRPPERPVGTLYLVPTPLDFGCQGTDLPPLDHSLPAQTLEVARRLTHWITENAKSTRAFLKRVDAVHPLAAPLQSQNLSELPRHVHKKGDHLDDNTDMKPLLAPALAGHDIGLVSEAGMPAIADPGSSIVRAAHALGVPVVPLVGPISLMLALAASGCNGQDFAFVGYLPQDAAARAQRIRELEAESLRSGRAQLFIETPYRNAALLQSLIQTLKPGTRLAVASGLTLPNPTVRSQRVGDWRSMKAVPKLEQPTVFIVGR